MKKASSLKNSENNFWSLPNVHSFCSIAALQTIQAYKRFIFQAKNQAKSQDCPLHSKSNTWQLTTKSQNCQKTQLTLKSSSQWFWSTSQSLRAIKRWWRSCKKGCTNTWKTHWKKSRKRNRCTQSFLSMRTQLTAFWWKRSQCNWKTRDWRKW